MMRTLPLAIGAGLLLGLLVGGRPANIGARPFRMLALLAFGVATPFAAELADLHGLAARVAVLWSQLLLVAFAAVNLRIVGMPIALVGLCLNAAVLAANGTMPVRAEALVAAGAHEVERVELGMERRLEEPGDRLVALSDIVPVAPLREVVSFGDLILAAGLTDIAFRMIRPTGARRRAVGPASLRVRARSSPVT